MSDLSPGSSWGPFRIDAALGRGPSGVVYRAVRTADSKKVCLKIFNEDVDEPTLRRIEDDTRRLLGLSHPQIARVESVARDGSRLYVATEFFDGRSLRGIGNRPAREVAELLLKSARALGAAWMRLILHRNLKPENILVSVAGDVRITDFAQFREATPYWSPERKANQQADLRGDLFSLGTIFKELLSPGDADLDALLHQMTRVETFERVQMVEDVISRLETWTARQPATATTAPAIALPPPPAAPDPIPSMPAPPSVPSFPAEPDWEMPDPALETARASMVRTLGSIARRTPVVPPISPPRPNILLPAPRMEPPPPPPPRPPEARGTPPPPPPPPRVEVSPLPVQELPPPPSRSRPTVPAGRPKSRKLLNALVWFGLVVGIIVYQRYQRTVKARELDAVRQLQEEGRLSEAKKKLEDQVRKDKATAEEKALLEEIKRDEWSRTLTTITLRQAEGKYAEALTECERYLKKAGDSPPAEAVELRKSLKAWTSAVSQAEQFRKYGADKQAAETLAKTGEARKKDAEAILAKWCDEDWAKTKTVLDTAITQNDPYSALAELDRFLKKPHQGGSHRQDAEVRKLFFQADIDYGELVDRLDTIKARFPADAAALLEAFLAKPHGGGGHREDAQKLLDQLKGEAKAILFAGRVSIARMAASPEGKRVAFTSDGVKILDAATHEELWTAPVKSLLKSIAFGGEDRLLTGTTGKVQAWDLAEKKELHSVALPNAFLVAFAVKPDGKTVVGALSDGTLFTWDSGRDDPPTLEKEAAPGVVALALTRDGSRLALALRDKTLRVRELSGGRELKWAGPPVTVSAMAISPDGRRVLAGGANGMVTVWTAETGEAGPGVTGHTGSVTCAAFSLDGTLLATGGADAKIQIAAVKDGTIVKTLAGHRGRISSIAFVPGALISSASDGSVRIWPLK